MRASKAKVCTTQLKDTGSMHSSNRFNVDKLSQLVNAPEYAAAQASVALIAEVHLSLACILL